ncbi:hypothetical protein GCM10007862_31450 [Dyella lipolytica]|uniref:Lipoprotein n=1 Tax=Dyella lipolytica TaxID=1867835 RepID=A0ABW8IZ62_9GAMM|nr:DUF6491 family protein [Dyella lipolytica]GLQ48094.1 hypothetical protein GCM10007862_31450 [Dyella lipolytica]
MTTMRVIATVWLVALLAACSSAPYAQRMQQRQDAYNAAAGAPVPSFRFLGRMWSWEPLSNSQLVVYTVPSRAYLLDVWACPNLTFANAIGLTSSIREVSANLDKVLTGRPYVPCPIIKIRPIDLAKLQLEQQAQREVDVQSRADGGDNAAPPADH